MTAGQHALKRAFDILCAGGGLLVLWPLIALLVVMARRDTGLSGMFRQERIGRGGRPFTIYKLRTMKNVGGSTVTVRGDARITPLGATLRRFKLDELPQLWNVLKGDMSLVGPRPDVAGYMDAVGDDYAEVKDLRPGITGPATLAYRDEEELLAAQQDPQAYNDEVIWPDKLRINREYARNWSLGRDLGIIWRTLKK